MDHEGFGRKLAAKGIDPTTLQTEVGGTLLAPWVSPEAAEELPLLVGDQGELVLGEQLGRGGMGLVHAARQRSLGREVAVKSAVSGSRDRHEVGSHLIREARVTGALEHPNVVPVHVLGRNEQGDALLVMKRIEGTAWADLLRARPAPMHELDRDLEIFMDVCQTIHFAHSRGVIHRDIKPENVMVGSFGEVYVLDWGLALAITDRSISGLPHVGEVESLAGTPQYMAPEMTMPDGVLDQRSDTFLLGATLHVLLTGRPPHRGLTVLEVMFNAHGCEAVTFDDDVPRELASICKRALSREPAERYASAEQLRQAIAEFRRHASARALVAQAWDQLRELRKLVNDSTPDDLAVHRACSASRFGFVAALRVWPESTDARAGELDAIHLMLEHEIRRRHLDAARVLFDELDEPGPDLADKMRTLADELAAEARRQARGEAVAREIDLGPNTRARTVLYLVSGVAWSMFGIVTGILFRSGIHVPTHHEIAAAHGAVLVAMVATWWWMRSKARLNRVERVLMEVALIMLVAAVLCWLAMGRAEVPLPLGLAIVQTFLGLATWGVLSFVDRGLLVAPILVIAGAPATLFADRWAFDVNGAIVGVAILITAWRWQAHARPTA